MANILVTGAAGFIGQWVVPQLVERGDKVTCLSHRASIPTSLKQLDVQIIQGDVRDENSLKAAVKNQSVVLNLAGRTVALNARGFQEVNTDGARNMAAACAAQTTPPVFCHISSLAAAGPSQPGQPRKETNACLPISLYGKSKLDGEQAARAYASEVPISIIRPPFVIGEGDEASRPLFRDIKRYGLQIARWGPALELSLIHAQDLATAMLSIADEGARIAPSSDENRDPMKAAIDQGIFYTCDPTTLTYKELGRAIGKVYGRKTITLPLPHAIMWAGCAARELLSKITHRPSVYNRDKIHEAFAPAWTCSGEKIERELGFSPAVSIDKRIEQTAEWYFQGG